MGGKESLVKGKNSLPLPLCLSLSFTYCASGFGFCVTASSSIGVGVCWLKTSAFSEVSVRVKAGDFRSAL